MCALKTDIDTMPGGDLKQVGERGLNLSGGQKMRVSIARAIYSSANVIILVCDFRSDFGIQSTLIQLQDDVFSSLDNEVVAGIFEKCIKKVLAKCKRTVILVTQKTQLVYSADYVSCPQLLINLNFLLAATFIKFCRRTKPSADGTRSITETSAH